MDKAHPAVTTVIIVQHGGGPRPPAPRPPAPRSPLCPLALHRHAHRAAVLSAVVSWAVVSPLCPAPCTSPCHGPPCHGPRHHYHRAMQAAHHHLCFAGRSSLCHAGRVTTVPMLAAYHHRACMQAATARSTSATCRTPCWSRLVAAYSCSAECHCSCMLTPPPAGAAARQLGQHPHHRTAGGPPHTICPLGTRLRFCLLSSIFCLLSSVSCLLSLVFCLLSSVFFCLLPLALRPCAQASRG